MDEQKNVVRKSPLPWWFAGLMLGLVQITAIGLYKPLGVSTEYVVADAKVINKVAPAYAKGHPLLTRNRYQREMGYGSYFILGILAGALVAALISRRWKLRGTTEWWKATRGKATALRMVICFIGGVLILFGARLAHGCTTGQLASGWAQLALSAVPFTIAMFLFGIITARIVYRKVPEIQE